MDMLGYIGFSRENEREKMETGIATSRMENQMENDVEWGTETREMDAGNHTGSKIKLWELGFS